MESLRCRKGQCMGIYLNSKSAYTLYKSETEKPYFVDKTKMLEELFPFVQTGNNHICITRPRRFGKTVMANMISSFFSKAFDAKDIFQQLKIAQVQDYENYINRFPVIHISFNESYSQCNSYEQYIDRIEKRLVKDLQKEYPKIEISEDADAAEAFLELYTEDDDARFVFVLDEWDFIFHQSYIKDGDKRDYLTFLRNLLKDRPYVRLAYMTGILPIAKYSSGSELNMFSEFTMASEERFSEYFGFTEEEVDLLYQRYQNLVEKEKQVTREGLKEWYDGYHTKAGERLYNPRSVVMSLSNNNLGNYWTSSGPYDEIFYYIEQNVDAVRDDLARMISGNPVQAKIREYAATSQELKTKDEIFSAMIVYGFLSCESGKVSIPNKELGDKFAEMLQREPSLGYVHRLAKESEVMLQATLAGDTKTMEKILELVHDTEIIFYPETDKSADCIILELKVDRTPDEAIRQIREKNYALRFQARMGEKPKYSGRILAVGIAYGREQKKHSCKVEVLDHGSVS